jgi:hypothetical protein
VLFQFSSVKRLCTAVRFNSRSSKAARAAGSTGQGGAARSRRGGGHRALQTPLSLRKGGRVHSSGGTSTPSQTTVKPTGRLSAPERSSSPQGLLGFLALPLGGAPVRPIAHKHAEPVAEREHDVRDVAGTAGRCLPGWWSAASLRPAGGHAT